MILENLHLMIVVQYIVQPNRFEVIFYSVKESFCIRIYCIMISVYSYYDIAALVKVANSRHFLHRVERIKCDSRTAK